MGVLSTAASMAQLRTSQFGMEVLQAQQHQEQKSTLSKVVGGLLGGVGGFLVGGPVGAAIGAGVGAAAGKGVANVFSSSMGGRMGGSVVGGLVGAAFGPVGSLVGSAIGGAIGGKIGQSNQKERDARCLRSLCSERFRHGHQLHDVQRPGHELDFQGRFKSGLREASPSDSRKSGAFLFVLDYCSGKLFR